MNGNNTTDRLELDHRFVSRVLARAGGWKGADKGSLLDIVARRYPDRFRILWSRFTPDIVAIFERRPAVCRGTGRA